MTRYRAAALELAALRQTNPRAWERKLNEALMVAGSVPKAAALLGIGERTLRQWVRAVPSIATDCALKKPGWPPRGGLANKTKEKS